MAKCFSLNGVTVDDTFAEAFPIVGARLLITAASSQWSRTAAQEFCGDSSSVIGCDLEAAIESYFDVDESPDGRPGCRVLAFAFNRNALEVAVSRRVGQSVLTCPTTACYNGLPAEQDDCIGVGALLRYFGDGFQISKKIGNRRLWRIPVMDGEFVCEDKVGTTSAIAGGNLILVASNQTECLHAAETAISAMRNVPNAVLPFPGGIVRSGSKVGSRYPKLKASTNDAWCPTLRAQTESKLTDRAGCVYEIVIDGLDSQSVQNCMRAGLHAAVDCPGLLRVSAGNYGGKLGPHHFHLKDLL